MAATVRESPSSRRAPLSDDDARRRLLGILDDSKTFEELTSAITAACGAKDTHRDFGHALRFIEERDPSGLDAVLQERFAQVLSRMVESKEALALAGMLESSDEG
jgi:hypothetical protein